MANNGSEWTWKLPPQFWKGMAIGSVATIIFIFARAQYLKK